MPSLASISARIALNLRGLRRREAGLVDERLQLVGRGVAHLVPRGERAAETGVRPHVLDLLGHPRQNEEDQIVERVFGVEVTGLTVSLPQPLLDLSNPTVIVRRRLHGLPARHGAAGVKSCSLSAPSRIVESRREAGRGTDIGAPQGSGERQRAAPLSVGVLRHRWARSGSRTFRVQHHRSSRERCGSTTLPRTQSSRAAVSGTP